MREGIVIGEGVVLDARPASFVTRGLALALDLLVVLVFFVATLFVLGASLGSLELDLVTAILIAFSVLVMVVIPTTVETLSRGRSLGKLALGIRVVRDDGGPVRFRHAFLRALVGVGEIWLTFGSVALVASLTNDNGKRLALRHL